MSSCNAFTYIINIAYIFFAFMVKNIGYYRHDLNVLKILGVFFTLLV